MWQRLEWFELPATAEERSTQFSYWLVQMWGPGGSGW